MFFWSDIPQQSNADVWVFIRAYYWILACLLMELDVRTPQLKIKYFKQIYQMPIDSQLSLRIVIFSSNFYFIIENILMCEVVTVTVISVSRTRRGH